MVKRIKTPYKRIFNVKVKTVLAFIAVSQGPLTANHCARFVGSYLACPPGDDCSVVVVCNGGALPTETALMFDAIGAQFLVRENDAGWDVSGFQSAAAQFPCDLLACCGVSIYWLRAGWFKLITDGWRQFGPGMYGMFSSHICRAHMNTSGFAVTPLYLQQYPKVKTHAERYEFEHGVHAMWRGIHAQGRPCKLVTWDGFWDPRQWRYPQNILFRGDQSNCIAWCNHVDRFFQADMGTKMAWSKHADGPFV